MLFLTLNSIIGDLVGNQVPLFDAQRTRLASCLRLSLLNESHGPDPWKGAQNHRSIVVYWRRYFWIIALCGVEIPKK